MANPATITATIARQARPDRMPCTRPALPIMFRCDEVHFFLSVSKRMLRNSHSEGDGGSLGLAFHNACTVGKSQFGPTPPSLSLLAGQPIPQRMNQIVVGQLVILLASFDVGLGIIGRFTPFWVGGGDEPDFAVQNADQILEFLRDDLP